MATQKKRKERSKTWWKWNAQKPNSKNSRIFALQRTRGGPKRYYVDLRDLGGKRAVPLIVAGDKRATKDLEIAEAVAAQLENDLRQRRLRRVHNLPEPTDLQSFIREHLIAKRKAGRVTERTIGDDEARLARALAFFGATRALDAIGVTDVRAWLSKLQDQGLAGGTLRAHLHSLSNMYRRAASENRVPVGYNPAAALMDKPRATRVEARWLEVPDAALLLESARTYGAAGDIYALVATFLLTGGLLSEVLCLEADDLSFDRATVTFRPNATRAATNLRQNLKTDYRPRVVPMWPQLAEILKPFLAAHEDRTGQVFPGYLGGKEKDLNELLDAVAARAGWKAGEIRTKMFRHTYCAARLQTLDQGAPVAKYTVEKELGHGSAAMIEKIYGHLGEIRHRAENVEYRIEQHAAKLKDRLANLRGAKGKSDAN
jgi:integrase